MSFFFLFCFPFLAQFIQIRMSHSLTIQAVEMNLDSSDTAEKQSVVDHPAKRRKLEQELVVERDDGAEKDADGFSALSGTGPLALVCNFVFVSLFLTTNLVVLSLGWIDCYAFWAAQITMEKLGFSRQYQSEQCDFQLRFYLMSTAPF